MTTFEKKIKTERANARRAITRAERIKAANPKISDEQLEKQLFDVPKIGTAKPPLPVKKAVR